MKSCKRVRIVGRIIKEEEESDSHKEKNIRESAVVVQEYMLNA